MSELGTGPNFVYIYTPFYTTFGNWVSRFLHKILVKGHFTVFVLLQTGHLETCFFHKNYSWVYFKSLNA